MSDLYCIRCKARGDAIREMPHKGNMGKEIQEKICARCWDEWNKESVKIINERRLNLAEASARAYLATQMKIFLTFIQPPNDPPPTVVSSL